MNLAAKLTLRSSRFTPPVSAKQKYYWAARAFRGAIFGQPHLVQESLRAYSDLSPFFAADFTTLSVDRLHSFLVSLRIADIQHDIDILPVNAPRERRDALTRWLCTWSSKRPRLSLTHVVTAEGLSPTSTHAAADALRIHWAAVFAQKAIDLPLAQDFVNEFGCVGTNDTVSWTLPFVDFRNLLSVNASPAPGPDGLGYPFWQDAPEPFIRMLYNLYLALLSGTALPHDFNHAYIFFLLKSRTETIGQDVHRTPNDLRPIACSNAAQKILSRAILIPLSIFVSPFIFASSRGGIRGRQMLDNFVELESFALELAATSLSSSAIILTDFSQAFASLSWDFLFLTLQHVGVPENIITAIRLLYANADHQLVLGRTVYPGFMVLAGIKQGCPLSALLFCIALDPFIRALNSRLSITGGRVCSYLDDIGFTIPFLLRDLSSILQLFGTLADIASLRLKNSKCIIIPLWAFNGNSLTALLREHCPSAKDFRVKTSGKYLGIFIGPDAADSSWCLPLRNFLARARDIRSLGLGVITSLRLFNQQCLPVLSFVASVLPIPPQARRLEHRVLQILTAAPRHAWPSNLLMSFKMVGVPVEAMSLVDLGLSSSFRLSRALPSLSSASARLRDLWSHDDSILDPRRRAWVDAWVHSSVSFHLLHAGPSLSSIIPIKGEWLGDRRPHVQASICRSLRAARPAFPLASYLTRRFSRWFGDEADARARCALDCLCLLRHRSRPLFLIDLLSIWLNAWCTARRFGRVAPCLFCGACGDDGILSIFSCPAVFGSLLPLLGLPIPASRADALCVSAASPALTVRRALFASICRSVHNSLRAHGSVPSQAFLYQLGLARLRKYARDDRRIRSLLSAGTWRDGIFSLGPAPLV